MNKIPFLLSLHEKLSSLPKEDVEERLRFYSEMIEDRMEEGLSEEEAVAAVGSAEEIAAQILGEMPPVKPEKVPETPIESAGLPKKGKKTLLVLLLILGLPLWFPLLVAAAAVAVSLYVSLWAVMVSLWSVFASLAACALAGVVVGAVFALGGKMLPGLAMVSAGLVCGGLAIFLFFGCRAATKATVLLLQKTVQWLRSCFRKKEAKV